MEAAGRSLAGSRPAFPRGPALTPLHQAGALQGPHAAGLPPPREDLQPGTTPRWGTTRTSSRAREREKLKGVKGF